MHSVSLCSVRMQQGVVETQHIALLIVTPYVLAGGGSAPAHLLLQRILYKINRMNFFW